MGAETCSNGIEQHVASDFEEVGVAFDTVRRETSLEQVALVSVAPVEPNRIAPVQAVHSEGQIGRRRLDDNVVVVRHQAVGVLDPAVF
jgi:hypothetical protein